MRYHTTIDHIGIAVDTDHVPSTLTLTDSRSHGSVTIDETQLALIKLVRRGFTDLFDAARDRERGASHDA